MSKSYVTRLAFLSLSYLVSCSRSPEQYISTGNSAYEAGNYEAASLAYRKALQQNSKSGEAWYRLGLAQIKQEKLTDAYTSLGQALPLLPGNEDLRVKLGDLALAGYVVNRTHPRALYNQVGRIADDLLAKNPQSFDGFRLKAQLLSSDGKLEEAIQLFRQAAEIRPMQPEVVEPLVQVLIRKGDYKEAERLATALIERKRDFGPIYNILYLLYAGTGRGAEAERILQAKVQSMPTDLTAALELANHYINVKKPTELAATLKGLIGDSKTFPLAPLRIGDFFAEKRDYTQALHYYDLGASRSDKTQKPDYVKKSVLAYLGQGKRGDAMRLLDSLIVENPKDDDARNLRAVMWLESGEAAQLPAAVKEFQGIVERSPNTANYRYNLGRAFYATGNLDGAGREMTETLRLQSGYNLARLFLADISQRRGQFPEAQRYAEEVLAVDPGNVRAGLSRAISLLSNRNNGEARAELNRLLRDHPDQKEIQLQMGMLELAERRYAEADRIFARYYGTGVSDLRALSGLVESSIARNQLGQAARLLEAELQRAPGAVPLRMALAQVYRQAGRTDDALAQYQQVLKTSPQLVDVHLSVGQLLERKGDLNGALAEFKRASELDPASAPAAGFMAQVLANLGRNDDAIASYRASLKLQPKNPELLNNLAYALAESGRSLDEALELAQRAMAVLPQSDGIQDTIGFVYLKKGATDSALQVFNNVVKKKPDLATYHLHLAMALSQKGDKDGSRRALDNALANRPTDREKVEIQQMLKRLTSG